MTGKTGILLMAYGSPGKTEDVPEYLSDIYEGKPVPEYAMMENMKKYRMVKGVSPSNAIIDSLAGKLRERLSEFGMDVYLGNKHWHPKLDVTLEEMKKDRVEKIIAIPLFPFQSNNVKSSYLDPALKSLGALEYSPDITFINGFSQQKKFMKTWSSIIRESLSKCDENTTVFFSAHSLPLFRNDENSYNNSYRTSAAEIGAECSLQNFKIGYQSKGKYGNRWLEPSLKTEFDKTDTSDLGEILAVPLGFCYEHLEILYDLDIEFGEYVKYKGVKYSRTPLPDSRDTWIDMFVDISLENREVN